MQKNSLESKLATTPDPSNRVKVKGETAPRAALRLTIIVAGLRLEGAEGLDLGHAAPGVVGVTGAVLQGLFQTWVQIHHLSCKMKEIKAE